MGILPFICLGTGITLGIIIKKKKFVQVSDKVSTIALIFLMLTIGIGIGLDKTIVSSFLSIGLNCSVIALSAIFFSVVLVVLCEKTLIPLGKLDLVLQEKEVSLYTMTGESSDEPKKVSHLVWIMPSSVVLGLAIGILFRPFFNPSVVDLGFILALVTLYICVGISQGVNKGIFSFIKVLGFKIIWLSVAILLGSLLGGLVAGLLLDVPLHLSVTATGGMSFYSITGAYMTNTYGVEAGTYGFLVNILRETFTILLMPILIKMSVGSPMAGGAAGNMDTMLAPITKFVGVRLGLVALVTGTILTFTVPFLLPLLSQIL